MHPVVAREMDRILGAHRAGGDVLEIGARPSPDTLLLLPALRGATRRVGIDLDGPHTFGGVTIERGDAHALPWPAASFDTVVCNSVLEHDPRFWLTLGEIRRVARPGAVVALGVPGYRATAYPVWLRVARPLRRLPVVGAAIESALASTPTLVVHDYPADYYRFTARAMREVLLDGLRDVEVTQVLAPPRILGVGVV
jgi:SAM-dependent methyltransferase